MWQQRYLTDQSESAEFKLLHVFSLYMDREEENLIKTSLRIHIPNIHHIKLFLILIKYPCDEQILFEPIFNFDFTGCLEF